MKVGEGRGIVEKNRSRRGLEKSRERTSVEYFVVGCEVAATFIIIFGMCRRKGIKYEDIACVDNNSRH
jgi:hypothetical protein